jgi:regulatory protein
VEDGLERALALALRRLNRRELTTAEMRHHLERDGIDPGTIEAAVVELTDARYLDDERFARLFTEDRRRLDGWGADRIRRALGQQGIDRELIEAVVSHESDEEVRGSELERALVLLRQRFASPPEDRRARDRALGMLLRKGYDGELALDALAAYTRGE